MNIALLGYGKMGHAIEEIALQKGHQIVLRINDLNLEDLTKKKKWVNAETKNVNELCIISKRLDEVPGTHSVKYTSSIDDIEIIHTAHNRQGFAQGAVLAAEYIADKKGIFSMKDVLNF